jgi:heme exporter protein C
MKDGIMRSKTLLGLSFVLMVASLYLVFVYVPTEKEMGIVQRIFYIMVPMGWLALLSFAIVFVSSILYLRKRKTKWDDLGRSSAEVGLVVTTLALIVGAIWAKPIWGVWWTWEPRLTATLVLWLIYLAYLIVRSFATDESQGARFAAVVGIIGFIDVPIIALATSLWRGMHPGAIIFQGGLAPPMLLTLLVSLAAFTAFYLCLLGQRVGLREVETEINKLSQD